MLSLKLPQVNVHVGLRRRLDQGLDAFQILVVLGVLVACFLGRGKPFWLLMATAILPFIRVLYDLRYRQSVASAWQGYWKQLRQYPDRDSRIPLRAAFFVIILPAALLNLSNVHTSGSGDTWPVLFTTHSLLGGDRGEIRPYVPLAPTSYQEAQLPSPSGRISGEGSSLGEDPRSLSQREGVVAQSPSPSGRGVRGEGLFLGEDPHSQERGDAQPPHRLYCTVETARGLYSRYPSGMVPMALPVVAVSRLLGADAFNPRWQPKLEKWTAAWVGAAGIALFFLVARHASNLSTSLVAAFLLATGSAMFSTVGQLLWQHGGIVIGSLVFLLVEFHARGRPSRWGTLSQALAGSMMLACRLSAGLEVLILEVWVLLRDPKRGVVTGALTAACYVPWALAYYHAYGNPFGPATGQLEAGNWGWDWLALTGLLASPARGLFVYQSWLLLPGILLIPHVRRSVASPTGAADLPSGWRRACGAVIIAHFGLVSLWHSWWGGDCWGSRLLTEIVPLAALLCLPAIAVLTSRLWGRLLLSAIGAVGFFVHGAGVYWETYWEYHAETSIHPERVWSWEYPPFVTPFLESPWPKTESGERRE